MNSAEKPRIAHRKGFYFEVRAGHRYLWCACGRSANQPFCDGSHNNLPGATVPDDPDSPANRAVMEVPHGAEPVVPLDGTCYVFSTARARLIRRGAMAYCPVVTPARGALYHAQFYAEVASGASPVIGANGRHTVVFVSEGHGQVEIAGRCFALAPCTGFYVRPGEAFRVHNAGRETIKLFIASGPGAEDLAFLDAMPQIFDDTIPNRMAAIDPALRQAMGERFFQILVNRAHGSTEMTQFIGNIPLSKAEPHRHLYEEVVIVLNGAGVVWTDTKKTTVGPGDVLFLPRKQTHSVQCTVARGLDVVGVIYPGDNPSISF